MVGIVILNYNNSEDTINCILSIAKYNSFPVKIVVVDNASPRTDAVEILTQFFLEKFSSDFSLAETLKSDNLPKYTFAQSSRNGGYAQGNNIGLELLYKDPEIDYVMILNNDILFIEDIIPKMIECFAQISDAGIVSPLLLKKDCQSIDYNCARKQYDVYERIKQFWLWMLHIKCNIKKNRRIFLANPHLLNEKVVPIDLPSGSCMLAKKDFFCSIGGFDPNTFLYFEEDILFAKTSRKGKVNYILPQVKCVHLGAQSIGAEKRSVFQIEQSYKSELYYVMNYSSLNFLKKIAFWVSANTFRFYRLISFRLKRS
ncbi:glycosyltransferase [Fibrobacter sp.]